VNAQEDGGGLLSATRRRTGRAAIGACRATVLRRAATIPPPHGAIGACRATILPSDAAIPPTHGPIGAYLAAILPWHAAILPPCAAIPPCNATFLPPDGRSRTYLIGAQSVVISGPRFGTDFIEIIA
jgi:hypothetical protein